MVTTIVLTTSADMANYTIQEYNVCLKIRKLSRQRWSDANFTQSNFNGNEQEVNLASQLADVIWYAKASSGYLHTCGAKMILVTLCPKWQLHNTNFLFIKLLYKSKITLSFTYLLMWHCLNISLQSIFCTSSVFNILTYCIPWTVVIHLQDAPGKQYYILKGHTSRIHSS